MQKNHTIKQAISQYIGSLSARFSPQTVLAYSQALRLFEHLLQKQLNINPAKASAHDIATDWAYAYLTYLQEAHSIETEHLYSRAILGFYQYAEYHDPSLAGMGDALTIYLTTNRRPKQHLSPELPLEAMHTILFHVTTAAPPPRSEHSVSRETLRMLRDKAFLLTLAHTGLRVSEICGLRLADIDLEYHTLSLAPELPLPIPSTALAAIKLYLAERQPLDNLQRLFNPTHLPLFARHDKKAANKILSISRWTAANIVHFWTAIALPLEMRSALITNNCPITPQTFRHYFVITTLQATGNIQETQTLARHIDTTTTRRYLRFIASDTDIHH
jgi:integrase